MRRMEHGRHSLRDGHEETSFPRYGKITHRCQTPNFSSMQFPTLRQRCFLHRMHADLQTLTDIIRMICEESPRPLPEGTSTPISSLISKMLRKDSLRRPKIDQLVVCPYIVPFIIRIYLNLGRISNVVNNRNGSYDPEIFLRFLKSQVFNYIYVCVYIFL